MFFYAQKRRPACPTCCCKICRWGLSSSRIVSYGLPIPSSARTRARGWVRRGFIIQSIMRLCGTDNVVAGYYVRTPITRDQSQVSVSVVTASSSLMILHKYTSVHRLAPHQATTTTRQSKSFLFQLLGNVLNFGCGMLINWDLSRNYSDIVWSWSVTIKYN